MPTAINRETGERLVLTDGGWAPMGMPVDQSAFDDGGYRGTYAERKAQTYNDWLNRWYDRTKGVATGYRTDGRRRSDNVIDARWNVPGETSEQQAARLWHAHDRGVDRAAHTMIPTIISRNPKLEGKKPEPLFFEGSDRLIPTAADMERIMARARSVDVSAFDPPSKVR